MSFSLPRGVRRCATVTQTWHLRTNLYIVVWSTKGETIVWRFNDAAKHEQEKKKKKKMYSNRKGGGY